MHYCMPGCKYTEHDKIQFNDSKRPYQTDNIDAYIIHAYDDKITDDTTVIDVNNITKMTVKDFIALLSLYDTDKEILESINLKF